MATGTNAVPKLSTVRVRASIFGHRRERIGLVEERLASAVRLCYETPTDGAWDMRIDCACIFIVCKNNDYSSIAVSLSRPEAHCLHASAQS